MRKLFRKFTLHIICILITVSACFICTASDTDDYVTVQPTVGAVIGSKPMQITYPPPKKVGSMVEIVDYTDDEEMLSNKDIELIALVTMAEAEGECEKGKRLVIDAILNRVDSEYFPNTVYEVIYQPNQFSSMWNGRVDRCEVQEDICQLVKGELKERLNYEVMFFTAGDYGKYGKPMFPVENHYFSSYD